jgi:hypothetical protein
MPKIWTYYFNLSGVYLLVAGMVLLAACTPQISSTPQMPTIEPEPTSVPSPTALIENTPTPLPPPNPAPQITAVFQTGNCATIPHPFLASVEPDTNSYTLTNPIDKSICTFQLTVDDPEWDSLDVAAYTSDGLWLTATRVAETNGERWYEFDVVLYFAGFDGAVSQVMRTPINGNLLILPEQNHIFWSENGLFEPDGNDFYTRIWRANIDGSEPEILYEQIGDYEFEDVKAIHFLGLTEVNNLLFSLEPMGRGGSWVYVGDYSNLQKIPVTGGTLTTLFDCDPDYSPFCIGGFSQDFSQFAYTDRDNKQFFIAQVDDGTILASTSAPDRDFIGRPIFNANGDVAFVVTDIEEAGGSFISANPQLNLLNYPYDEPLVSHPAPYLMTLSGFFDDDHLLTYHYDGEAPWQQVSLRDGTPFDNETYDRDAVFVP